MTEKVIKVGTSLEARPAAMFVQTASKFQSSIYVEVGNKRVNGKSIMGMISMGILDDQSVKLIANGADEAQAISELEVFFA
jgi:phosphotransferase system HPr (HPr) family protein